MEKTYSTSDIVQSMALLVVYFFLSCFPVMMACFLTDDPHCFEKYPSVFLMAYSIMSFPLACVVSFVAILIAYCAGRLKLVRVFMWLPFSTIAIAGIFFAWTMFCTLILMIVHAILWFINGPNDVLQDVLRRK